MESASRHDLFTNKEESDHRGARVFVEVRSNGVFDHLSKVVPVVALRMNPVAKRVRLVPSISRFHDFKDDLIHGEILLWMTRSHSYAHAVNQLY